jgi:O-antigen/teichoic acid export membrane protein
MIKKSLELFSSRMMIMLCNQLAVIVTIPWLTMELSRSVFGLVSTVLILIQVGWVLIDWGLMNYVIEVWKEKTSLFLKNSLITNLITSRLLLCFFYLIIIFLLILKELIFLPWQFFIPLFLTTIFGAMFPLWFFHVKRSPRELVVITLISRLIFVLLTLYIVNDDSDALSYLYLHSISFSVITVYSFYLMRFKYQFRWEGFKFSDVTWHLKKGAGFFMNSLTNSNIYIIWGFAITLTQGPLTIGIYNIAEQGYRAGNAISNMIAEVARLNTKSLSLSFTWKLISFYLLIYFPVAIAGFFLAGPLVKFFFEQEYFQSVNLLQILICVWLVQSTIKLINYPMLGKLMTIYKIHKLTPFILLFHLIAICIWFLFFENLYNFALFFLGASLAQLGFFAILMKKMI